MHRCGQKYETALSLTWGLDGVVANDRRQSLYPRERAPVSILHEPGGVSILVSIGKENISAAGFRKPNLPARSESKPKTCCLKVERERISQA